jgi:hypothetical protein
MEKNMEDNYINKPSEYETRMVKECIDKGKIQENFFPLPTYDMVQAGYPSPDHGEMVPRLWGGTDEKGRLISPRGMWCKVEDVKKLIERKI